VVSDGLPPSAAEFLLPGKVSAHKLWFLNTVPAELTDARDPVAIPYGVIDPPPTGLYAEVVTYQPGYEYPWHQTASVDLIIVVAGRLELGVETGATVLEVGDCVVQRGTRHKWRVLGSEPCTFVAVRIGAQLAP
jgi:quercetin dioxygenase-like cupin family protein